MRSGKKGVMLLAVAGMIFGLAAASSAVVTRLDERTGTCRTLTPTVVRQGYLLFQENCKSCHSLDNAQGAPQLFAEKKSMRAWNRVFAQRSVDCARDGAWAGLQEEEVQLINDYLVSGAWNADYAGSCG